MSETRLDRLAVLIDADNASARIADGLFAEIAKLGEASVRRIYGDFSSPRSKSWVDCLARHAIIPQQQFAYTIGKNASDITLVIDAMDLMHSGRFDGFCLVSSDSDFTRLAQRLREQGVDVFGFGEQKTPESFRQACRRFIYTENLLPEIPKRASSGTPAAGPTEVKGPPPPLTPTAPKRPLKEAQDLVRLVIAEIDSDEAEGWVPLGLVGQRVANFASDFDPRSYGFGKLSDLVSNLKGLEMKKAPSGQLRVRIEQK